MSSNRGVVYLGLHKVEVQSIDYPKFQTPQGKPIEHGVILKIVSTNICGSDQHMVRGRTTAPKGIILGQRNQRGNHRKGKDVEFLDIATGSPFLSTSPAAAAPAGSATVASASM
jgi:glutathione-independent formaldehyde dehydrogenase